MIIVTTKAIPNMIEDILKNFLGTGAFANGLDVYNTSDVNDMMATVIASQRRTDKIVRKNIM